MSLKDFHLVFIACSILLAIFFGMWSWMNYVKDDHMGFLASAVFSVLTAAVLIVYAVVFKKRTDHGDLLC